MTPKEKAEELIDRFIDESVVIDDDIQYYHPKPFSLAKQCALIAIDEIIQSLDKLFGTTKECAFYKQVKQEIEKL
jgi:hypothetical protein